MNIPKVFVIVLNRNHRSYLEVSIRSLKKQSYPGLNIVVVDNASQDDSVEYLTTNHPNIKIFQNKKGLGWTGGNNIGIKYAQKMNADYIILANNDIEIDDDHLIEKLIKSFNHNNSLGIIGPRVNEMDQRNKLQSAGWNIYNKYYKYGLYFNKFKQRKYDLPKHLMTVDFVSGCFICIKKVILDNIGRLDENIFLYLDDLEFSFRAWRYGYVSVVNNDLVIYHKGSATTGKLSPLQIYYNNRNMLYFLYQNKRYINYYLFTLIHFNSILKLFMKFIVHRKRYKESVVKLYQALCRAIIDGILLKRYGQRYYE